MVTLYDFPLSGNCYKPRLLLHQLQIPHTLVLAVMEQHLSARNFFVGGRYGIADISLFAYTHLAEEGKFDLSLYPAVRAWLARVKAQPRFIPLQ